MHPPAGQHFICSPGLFAYFTPYKSAASNKYAARFASVRSLPLVPC